MSPTRIAVAGAGYIGQAHIDVALRSPHCTLSAIVDPSPSARAVADRAGVPLYATLDELLAQDRPDGLILATPNTLHVPQALQCVAAGLPILLEKPIATSVAEGRRLAELGLDPQHPPRVRGYAIQVRVNAEATDAQGLARPAQGRLERFDPPTGPDVRVDTHGYTGYAPSAHYDTLLAKLIVHGADRDEALARARRAVQETTLTGMASTLSLHGELLVEPWLQQADFHTGTLETWLAARRAGGVA